jgi:predicted ester cyclase
VSADAKALARRALDEIYANADLDLVDELIHVGYSSPEPAHPGRTGHDGVRETVRGLHAAFADLRFEIHDEIAEGDKVVQRVTMHGRQTGPLMDHEPTGRRFAMRQVHIWRIADGKLAEHWGLRDDLGMLTELGLFP